MSVICVNYISVTHYITCELKVCTTKKPENPSVSLTLPVAHELGIVNE